MKNAKARESTTISSSQPTNDTQKRNEPERDEINYVHETVLSIEKNRAKGKWKIHGLLCTHRQRRVKCLCGFVDKCFELDKHRSNWTIIKRRHNSKAKSTKPSEKKKRKKKWSEKSSFNDEKTNEVATATALTVAAAESEIKISNFTAKTHTKTNKVKMDSKSGESLAKKPISSTKSIDEGFESDPDRDHSTDSEASLFVSGGSIGSTSSIGATHSFDVLQRTDRDGVQHTQITRRPPITATGTLSASHLRRKKEFDKNMLASVYAGVTNSAVSIPRAGTNNGMRLNATTSQFNAHQMKSGELANRNRQMVDMSRATLVNGKLICVNKSSSTPTQIVTTTPLQSSQSSSSTATTSKTHPKMSQFKANVAHAIIKESSNMNSFYPAEGNISLIQSQYGLRYKSSHLSRTEQHAPVIWAQSMGRQPRR